MHHVLLIVIRLALRELRAGLTGFAVFLACIALGVMAIAGVASISRSLSDGLGREGRRILGGDLAYNLINREATDADLRSQLAAAEAQRDAASSELVAQRERHAQLRAQVEEQKKALAEELEAHARAVEIRMSGEPET